MIVVIGPSSKPSATTLVPSSSPVKASTENDFARFDEKLVEFLGKALEQVAEDGDDVDDHESKKGKTAGDVFVGAQSKVPHIGLRAYLKRMVKYMSETDCANSSWKSLSLGARSLICSIIYLDRIVSKSGMRVTSRRIHRFIVTGMLVSLKMNEDDVVDMGYFSMLAGIPVSQLHKLESAFLAKLDFDAFVSPDEFKERVRRFKAKARISSPSSSSRSSSSSSSTSALTASST